MDNKISYFVGVFGFLQLSMQDVGLLDKQGVPIKKKKMTLHETDAVYIYSWLSDSLKDVNVGKLRELAKETDKRVSKLISEHAVVNNFLLSILLLHHYIDNDATKNEQLLLAPKIYRVMELLDKAVTDEEIDDSIRKTTHRTADNIYRQATNKAQLSDDVRDAFANKYMRKK